MSFCIPEVSRLCRLGQEKANLLLPAPLRVRIHNHDTGRSAQVLGVGDLVVWRGSEWFHPDYEFNDQGLVGGIQPGCEALEPLVEDFLRQVKQQVEVAPGARVTWGAESVQARRDAENLQATLRALGL